MTNRMWLLIAFLSLCEHAMAASYLEKVHDAGYDSIFVAKILSANTVITHENGSDCYYKYSSAVVRQIRGKVEPEAFDFSSNAGLAVGARYLIFFSKTDALQHRIRAYGKESRCERNLSGYYLSHYVIHAVERLDDGNKLSDYVHFSDVLADTSDVPPQFTFKKDVLYIQLDYAANHIRN